MAAINSKEALSISEFRQRLTDLKLEDDLNSDLFLIRWLRARSLNLDQAEKMLRKHLQWRKDSDFDSLLSYEAPEAVTSTCGYLISGEDKEKTPFVVIPVGRWKLRKLALKGYGKDVARYYEQIFAKCLNEGKGKLNGSGVPVTQFSGIIDMEKLYMKTITCKAVVEIFLQVSRSFEANFPETLKTIYVLNAGKVFSIIFALLKPIMSQATMDKLKIYHNDKWKKDLFAVVAKDQIPVQYGGTSSKQVVVHTVAATDDGDDADADDGEAVDDKIGVTVDPGEILGVDYQVDVDGSSLSWSFETEDGDIGFSVFKDGKECMITNTKISKGKTVEGSLICWRGGSYKLLFDNSGNKNAVSLKYMADVTEPR